MNIHIFLIAWGSCKSSPSWQDVMTIFVLFCFYSFLGFGFSFYVILLVKALVNFTEQRTEHVTLLGWYFSNFMGFLFFYSFLWLLTRDFLLITIFRFCGYSLLTRLEITSHLRTLFGNLCESVKDQCFIVERKSRVFVPKHSCFLSRLKSMVNFPTITDMKKKPT